MHEIKTLGKKQANPWLWGCLVLGVALVVALGQNLSMDNEAAKALGAAQLKATKNDDALIAGRLAFASRERVLQERVDKLSASLAEAEERVKEANGRVIELTDQLSATRGDFVGKLVQENRIEAADSMKPSSISKASLLAEALKARDEGNLQLAKFNFEAMLAIDPQDMGAKEGLQAILYQIAYQDPWEKLNGEFLAKIDADKTIKRSVTGLRYQVIAPGHSARPKANSIVKCRYDGRLVDGRVFDSTKNRNNEPAEFPLNQVIPAWTEGLQNIGPGGKILLYSPHTLAYGEKGHGPIPGKSVLIFEVELLEVTQHR